MPLLSTLANASARGYRIFAAAETNSYESIATVTVGAGGSSSITFSSIPSTYKHLQIRSISRISSANYGPGENSAQFNTDTTYSNYYLHGLYANGATVYTEARTGNSNQKGVLCGYNVGGSASAEWMGTGVCDILDYANTNKYKTVRSLAGADLNGTPGGTSGYINFYSGLWMSTAAINQIVITAFGSQPFTQNSHFALYGIKG